MDNKGKIIIYTTTEGETAIDVRLEEETVWLTQAQMSILFGKTKQNISLHISNLFKEGELTKDSVVKEYLTTAKDGKEYRTLYFNLDVIISVGYRVKSKRGTQFRLWANTVLKEYLVKGYAINEQRLKEAQEKFTDLKKTIKLIERVVSSKALNTDETQSLIKVLSDYTNALDILDDYDHERITFKKSKRKASYKMNYADAQKIIKKMREKFGASGLFGRERNKSLEGSIAAIHQT